MGMNSVFESSLLLVDDSRELCRMIKELLYREGFVKVDTTSCVRETEEYFLKRQPDLIILDINLPDGDGFSLMRKIRTVSEVPVLFLSARDKDNDRLLGLGLGADDYIVKPFLPEELVLRITAILRRTYLQGGLKDDVLTLSSCSVNFKSGTALWQDGRELPLTAKELQILRKLYDNRGNIVTFDQLCRAVWEDNYFGYENTIMVHIRRLREKIEENPSKPKYLLTARGLGYKLVK